MRTPPEKHAYGDTVAAPLTSFEILRSGFLSDGRFYSIEAVRLKGGAWQAGIAVVPGAKVSAPDLPPIRVANYREMLRRWAEGLTSDEIEHYARDFSG
jgi:hypothetical protein